jgi:energy-coupling factor transporter ATP-binding protein EcfA2
MSKSPEPSPKNSRVPALVLALAASLGVPTGMIAVSTHFVTEHPWWSLALMLVFVVVMFVVYEAAKVWQRLEGPLLDALAERVMQATRRKLAGYDQHYCQYVINQHRDFDVKGLTVQGPFALELDQIFIELSIDPTTVREMSASLLPQRLREGNHTIWDYLASEALVKQQLVVVGPPGSGKTTLLKHIALRLVAPQQAQRLPANLAHTWPLLLFLRDHAAAIHDHACKGTSYLLPQALLDHLRLWDHPLPPPGWIERLLDRGQFLVMLDGLDEVADVLVRQEVVNWVRRQVIAHSQNRFLLTSRPGGYRDNPLEGVALLEVRSFTPEQVERFLDKWYLADETMRKQKRDAGVEMRARAEARGLLQQLHETPALLDLTTNPLLLSMIAIVHRYGGGGTLPKKRVGLYEDICKVFLGKRQEARRQELPLRHDQMQLVLEPLAYFMMHRGTRDIRPVDAQPIIADPLRRVGVQIAAEQFLKLVENVSGLLLEQESGIYWFAHKTFEEFLAATYITKNQLKQELTSKIEDVWWQETIRLCCALSDATPIISACLADERPSLSALLLALDCLNEAREVQPEVRECLTRILEQGLEDAAIERRYLAADILLTRRIQEMAYLNEGAFVSTSYVTCAEYQPFLDQQREQERSCQPDHWATSQFSPGQARSPILGVRASDAEEFCTWLTRREKGPWYYRLPHPDELDEHALSRLGPGTGFWLKRTAGEGNRPGGFKWRGEPSRLALSMLQGLLEQDFTRSISLDFDHALNRALDRARTLDVVLDLDHTLDCALNRARALDRALALNLAFDRTRALDLDRALNRALDRTCALDRARTRAVDRARADFLYITLLFVAIADARRQSSSVFTRQKEQQLDTAIESIIDTCIETYFALLILNQRMEGRLPACEGIVVVKEHTS